MKKRFSGPQIVAKLRQADVLIGQGKAVPEVCKWRREVNNLKEYIKNALELYCFLKEPKPKVPCIPNNIYIEPTNACNLRCIMCARAKMHRKTGYMNLSDFKIIIDKLVHHNWHASITLTGQGEPLLNKDLFSMIEYAKEKGFNISLISNSTLLDEQKAKLLLESGLDRFQAMFDSIDKDSFESLRVGADYEKTKANIINLIEMNERVGHPLFISIGLIETSLTKKIRETKRFWQSFPIDNFFHSKLLSLQSESGMYLEASKTMREKTKEICAIPLIVLSISYNGDAQLCPQDFNYTWVTGNVFKDELEEIWNGRKAQKLRKALICDDLNFFTSINHNCEKCNAPYSEEYTLKGYRNSLPSRIARKVRTFQMSEKIKKMV